MSPEALIPQFQRAFEFAQQQVKVIWTVLLQRFDLELAQPHHQPDYSTFVVGPRRPCIVRYRRK